MSDTAKHESNTAADDLEPFGQEEDSIGGIPARATAADILTVKPTPEPRARARAAAQPQIATEQTGQTETFVADLQPEPPVILKGFKLDPLHAFPDGGAVVEHNDKAVAAASDDEQVDETQYGGLVGILQKHGKVLGIAAALGIAGFIFMPRKAPVAPVSAPVAAPVATAPVAPVAGTTTAPVGAEGTVGVTGGVEAHVGAASPDDQARLAAELQTDAQAIPPGEQICSNPHITSFDSMRCGQVGPKLYFQCAPDGRRWDVRRPGCENG